MKFSLSDYVYFLVKFIWYCPKFENVVYYIASGLVLFNFCWLYKITERQVVIIETLAMVLNPDLLELWKNNFWLHLIKATMISLAVFSRSSFNVWFFQKYSKFIITITYFFIVLYLIVSPGRVVNFLFFNYWSPFNFF